MPAAEEQCHGESANGEHPKILRHEKGGVFEAGIFGHVAGDNFRFAFRDIEGSAVGFNETGDKKQNERGRAPWGGDEPMWEDAKGITILGRDNRVRRE